MTIKFSDKHYEKFNSLERLKLTLSALAKDNNQELKKLSRTCPKYTYTMIDNEFKNKVLCVTWISMLLTEIQYFHYNQILICESPIDTLTYLITDPNADEENIKHEAEILENLHDLKIKHITFLKSASIALAEFCKEADLDSEHIIQLTPPLLRKNIKKYLVMEEIYEDKIFTNYIKRNFFEIWNNKDI